MFQDWIFPVQMIKCDTYALKVRVKVRVEVRVRIRAHAVIY